MPLTYSINLGRFDRLKNDIALQARRAIFKVFMRECAPSPTSRVADLGVSGYRSHPAHYFFEELYPYRSNLTVIARASEGAGWFPDQFPGINYLEADLRSIPAPDLYFDFGICNAVVEHAGTREQQAALVKEVCRVTRCAMFTTPNKWLPIEVHTFLPLLHWLPDGTYRAILRGVGLGHFADTNNLNLLDAKTFRSLFPDSRRNRMLRIGPPMFATNLICISCAGRARA